MIYQCEMNCGRVAVDWHHKFSKTKANLKKYGKYLIHHPWNGMKLCRQCHDNIKPKWSEREFIRNMGLSAYCKNKIIACCYKKDFPSEKDCDFCREYEFNKELYCKDKGIKENQLIPGSFGYEG